MLQQLLTTPLVAWFLIGFLAVEAVLLLLLWRLRGAGLPPAHIVSFLGAGAAFAGALGCALAEMPPIWLAVSLLVAFIFHLADLFLRWQNAP